MPPTLDSIKLEQYAQEDPENISFLFHPSSALYEAPYPFHAFWHTLEENPKEYAMEKSFFLIHLEGLHSLQTFKERGGTFLQALQMWETLGKSLETVMALYPSFDLEKNCRTI